MTNTQLLLGAAIAAALLLIVVFAAFFRLAMFSAYRNAMLDFLDRKHIFSIRDWRATRR